MKSIATYGAAFKFLREQRGLTLKATAEGILTPHFLSKFEKEGANISLDNFNKLLIRLGITWTDFFEVYEGESVEFVLLHLHRCLNNYTTEEDILRHSLQDIPYSFPQNPFLKMLVHDIIKLHINYAMEANWQVDDEIHRVMEFMNRHDYWGQLEWTVYLLTLSYFPDDLIIYRSKEVMDSLRHNFHRTKEDKEGEFQILFDTIRYFSRKGDYQRAEWVIAFIEEELAKVYYNTYLNAQLLLKLQKAHHCFRKGDEQAHRLADEVINLMTMLEEHFNMPIMAKARDIFYWDIQKNNKTGKDYFKPVV